MQIRYIFLIEFITLKLDYLILFLKNKLIKLINKFI